MLDELTITGSAVAGASKRRRTRRIVMIIVSLLLLLTVGTGTAYVAFLNHIVTTNVKHAALLPATSPGESAPARQPAAKDAQNILLIGSDSRGSVAKRTLRRHRPGAHHQ